MSSQQDPGISGIQFFIDLQKTIKGLFTQIQGINLRTSDAEYLQGVARQLRMELEVYFKLEQELLLARLKDHCSDELSMASDLDEGTRTQQEIINDVHGLPMEGEPEAIAAEYTEVEQQVLGYFTWEMKHVIQPYTQMYENEANKPPAITIEEVKSRRQELISTPEYQNALPEEVQNPNGGEQIRKKTA